MGLFNERLRLQWKFNINIIRSVVDVTTSIYLVIFAIVFSLFLYGEVLPTIENSIITKIPLWLPVFLLLLFFHLKSFRTFIQPADRLFLIQSNRIFSRLKLNGFLYSAIIQFIISGVLISVLAPIFIKVYGMSWLQLIAFILLHICSSFSLAFIHFKSYSKWAQMLLDVIVAVAFTAAFMLLPANIVILLCIGIVLFQGYFYIKNYVESNRFFERQLALDQERFYRLQSLVFFLSMELRSMTPPKQKNKPLFWRNSSRLFKRTDWMLEETLVKTIVRNPNYRWGYLRLLVITFPMYIFLPGWVDIIVFGLLGFILLSWIESVLMVTREHKIFTIYKVGDERWILAEKRMKRWLVYIPLSVVGLVLLAFNILG
ncbi:ABC transporter permease [Lysinibacillus sp. 54212]|uniref:ABC transporter permease n=1 Tax=Lysinibacillus sp. 54212 TaxID=3119829 RepID=UPI002FCBCEB4